MAQRDYSFLDIAVLDEVRGRFAAGDALAILSDDLEEVIWANGPGAALLGHDDIESVMGAPADLPLPARRQIMATSGFPEIGNERPLAVRLTTRMTSGLVAFQGSRVTLPGGEKAILLAVPFGQQSPGSDVEIGARATGGFGEAGHFVALVDGEGRLAATSAGFAGLALEDATIRSLARDAATAPDRLVKRLVSAGRQKVAAGVARLQDEPVLSLLVIVREAASETADAGSGTETAFPAAMAHVMDETVSPAAMAGAQTPEISGAPTPEPTPAAEPGASAEADTAHPAPGAQHEMTLVPEQDNTAGASAPATAPAEAEVAPPRTPPEEDRWYFNAGQENGGGRAPAGEASAPSQQAPDAEKPAAAQRPDDFAPSADAAAAPVRFVWRTDAAGRFSAISDDFAGAVGIAAADIVGRSFVEVAASLGLDEDGEIADLLERRDTWSGRSVLWPVAGTDLRIPVDLAALPVYGRARDFEGFRGFGVARVADAVIDPGERGSMFDAAPEVVEPETQEPSAETTEPPAIDPFRGEVPALSVVPKQERRLSDKIIRLAEHRQPTVERGLSVVEKNAFREIGDRLKKDSTFGQRPAGVPPTTAKEAAEDETPVAPEEQKRRPSDRIVGRTSTAPVEPGVDAGASAETAPVEIAQEAGEHEVADAEAPREESVVDEPSTRGSVETGLAAATENSAAADLDAPATDERIKLEDEAPRADELAADVPAADEASPVGTAGEEAHAATAADSERSEAAPVDLDTYEPEPSESDVLPAAEAPTPPASDRDIFRARPGSLLPSGTATEPAPARDTPSPRPGQPIREYLPSAFATMSGGGGRAPVDTSILDKLPVPVLIHSGDVLHYANREFLEFTAYDSVEELADRGGLDVLFGDPYRDEGENDRADRKMRLRRGDGLELPVEALLQSVPWNGGKALLLALRKVGRTPILPSVSFSQEEKAELEARISELRTIIDTATDGVVLIANDGTIRSISRPAEALFGTESDDVAGKPFASLFAMESQRAARDYLNGLSENGVASVLNDGREVIGREAQGRFIPLFMTIGSLPNHSGYCAVVRDITQWKRAEEELTQSRTQAERASSQKTDFLARVSHEIRTPLNAIIGFSELMMDEKFGPIGNDRYRDYMRDINRSGNHVLDLVNDLLDISKIEAGEQEMSYEAVSLNDTLAETVATMQPQANRERVIIRSSFASRLPEVVADLRSVRQIALNLLSNAIRYTQAGGQVVVSTAYEPTGDVVMRVRDTGIGMSAADIEQALKPFKQINALRRGRTDGTGLGLPLTKAMVEANRAKFVITSAPGEGTLVEITFPSTRVLAD